MFLGLEGTGVILAYVCAVLVSMICVVYGFLNWNKPPQENEKKEIEEEIVWEQHEPEAVEMRGEK